MSAAVHNVRSKDAQPSPLESNKRDDDDGEWAWLLVLMPPALRAEAWGWQTTRQHQHSPVLVWREKGARLLCCEHWGGAVEHTFKSKFGERRRHQQQHLFTLPSSSHTKACAESKRRRTTGNRQCDYLDQTHFLLLPVPLGPDHLLSRL